MIHNNNFIMLSNGTDVIFKTNGQSYKFSSCFLKGFDIEMLELQHGFESGMNISIELAASECEYIPSDDTIANILEETKLEFGKIISRKLDI